MTITQQQIDAAALSHLQKGNALDAILSQVKMAKKTYGYAGGNRRLQDHIAAMQRQIDILNKLLSLGIHG